MQIVKCRECGNTFKTDKMNENDIVTCPICEANYQIQIKDGKVLIKDFIYEKEDFGELFE